MARCHTGPIPAMVLTALLLILVLPALAVPEAPVTITEGPSTPSTAPQFSDPALFTSAILKSTNTHRAAHNARAVRYNATLADFAAAYLAGDATCAFAHSGGPYGENMALGCADAQGCVDVWGDEGAQYDYEDPGFGEPTGHFTQLVWKNTTDVGCAARLCGASAWFMVCEYWPRGNVIGDFVGEVDPPAGGAALVRLDFRILAVVWTALCVISACVRCL